MVSRPKSIFIVEGKHDPSLISVLLIEKYEIAELNKVCSFYTNDGTTKVKHVQETRFLRDFFTQGSPFQFAIKSEGGKSFVLRLLGSIIEEIVREPEEVKANVYCMVDLDGNTEKQQLKDIVAVARSTMDRLSMKYHISSGKGNSFLGNSFYNYCCKITLHYNNEAFIFPLTISLANPTLESIVAKYCKVSKNKVKPEHVKKFALNFKNGLTGLV